MEEKWSNKILSPPDQPKTSFTPYSYTLYI